MRISSFIAGGFLPAAFAIPSTNYKLHDQRTSLHSRYVKGQAASGQSTVPARIALKQNNVEKAEQLIYEISDPDSPKYGDHLSPKEVVDLFAPNQQSIDSVRSWLTASGISEDSIKLSPGKGWIHFETTASHLGSLLKADYHLYTDKASSKTFFGTDSYSLPHEISELVDLVHPATTFSALKKRVSPVPTQRLDHAVDPNSLETCDEALTPKCIAAMYKIPKATLSKKGNDLAIYEEEGDDYAQEDLNKFYKAMQLDIPQGEGPIIHNINNASAPASDPSEAGSESELDFDMAIPILYPQKTSVWEMGPENSDNFDNFVTAFVGPYCHDNGAENNGVECNKYDQPDAVSISWGNYEDLDDVKHLKRQCTEWMKFGLAGTSVFVASGDNGVAEGQCFGPGEDIFVPDQACSCPYITAVGSTYLPKGSKVGDVEIATESFSSGGGFSNIFARPAWQEEAVSTYLSEYAPKYKSYNTTDGKIPTKKGQGIYNRGGRGYPDISAAGDNGFTITQGDVLLNGGTSMSCPIVAAMFNRINEERIHAGKKRLGFLNPAIYKAAAKGVWTDVVSGDQGHRSDACGTKKGFVASTGWDAVTGLGTPNYDKMLEYFGSL